MDEGKRPEVVVLTPVEHASFGAGGGDEEEGRWR